MRPATAAIRRAIRAAQPPMLERAYRATTLAAPTSARTIFDGTSGAYPVVGCSGRIDQRAVSHDSNDAHANIRSFDSPCQGVKRNVGCQPLGKRKRKSRGRCGIADARHIDSPYSRSGCRDSLAYQRTVTAIERNEDYLTARRDRRPDDTMVIRCSHLVLDTNAACERSSGYRERDRNGNRHRHRFHRLPFPFSIDCACGSPPRRTSPGEPDSVRSGGSVEPGVAGAGC